MEGFNISGIDADMAPVNVSWHVLYAKKLTAISWMLSELTDHPSFEDGEDLKDWVEAISTLVSFRPRTREDIETEVREEFDRLTKDFRD